MRTFHDRRPERRAPRRAPRSAAVGLALALGLAACGEEADLDPIDAEPAPTDEDDEDEAEDEPAVDDPADDEQARDDEDDEQVRDDEDDGVERLGGEPTTEEVSVEAESARLAVTDVRVGSHDGFDRIVFEVDGDGEVGYRIGYADGGTATSQGSGEPIEVEGDQALGVALYGMTYPGDEPEGVARWDGERIGGGDGGVVHEVVEDTIFEGIHTFVAGLDEQHPYVVNVLEDPDRVVIDVLRDG